MSPLESARKTLADAETRLDELSTQRDLYAKELLESEAQEVSLRQKRAPLPKVAEQMRLSAAARAYLTDIESEAAALEAALPDLERAVEREELLTDYGATGDAGTGARKDLDAAVREAADLLRPHLDKISGIHDRLEAAREGFSVTRERAGADAPTLEAEARARGHDLQVVIHPVAPPSDDDPALRAAFGLFQSVAHRHAVAKQAWAAQATRDREAAAQAKREQTARGAEVLTYALLERPDQALAALGGIVIGSQRRGANTRLPEHTEVFIARRNADQAAAALRGFSYQPLGEARA